MTYEAGITEIVYPNTPRWTGVTAEAESKEKAIEQFEARGFYRNLVVREINK